ncbi:putative cytochrome P450 superfamily protein isoform X4 [Iris pallida]|uniref:Cytochrome P450 superfamily protein isoform X4 n=1 Tax=Iris pallida TaxID=29817 RepID=A0AAX6GJT4_IRIPA|nr:putative cytochrome P450 superfamily protein isoform X4 [Iris pallida]
MTDGRATAMIKDRRWRSSRQGLGGRPGAKQGDRRHSHEKVIIFFLLCTCITS